MNQFYLVQAVDRFGQRIIVAVATTADGGLDARFGQTFAVANADVLRCASRSSLRSNVNCSRARDSKPASKPAARSSHSSKAGITRIVATAAWVIARRASTSISTANKTEPARQASCPPPASVMVVISDPPADRGQLAAPRQTEEFHLLEI